MLTLYSREMMEELMKFADLEVVNWKQGNTTVCSLTEIKTKWAFLMVYDYWEVGWQEKSKMFLFKKLVVQVPLFLSPSSLIIAENWQFRHLHLAMLYMKNPSIKTNILTFKRRCISLDTPSTFTMLNSLFYSVMIMQRPLASKLWKLILFY